MKDCNKCEFNGKCMQDIKAQPITYASGCTKYQAPKRMKSPMLHHLVYGGKIGQLADVLAAFKIQLVDIKRYPKFKLVWEGK